MNFQDLVSKIHESRGPKGSFDDATPEEKPLAQIIRNETFDSSIVFEAIRKSEGKVTSQLLEHYHGVASSKGFSTDPVVLEILESSQFKFANKYLFVIEGKVVALSKNAIQSLVNEDKISIQTIRNNITERLHG